MSVLIRFAPSSLTAEQYDAVVRRLTEEGVQPADGLDYEVCFGSGDMTPRPDISRRYSRDLAT